MASQSSMPLTSAPLAWLWPFYARLRSRAEFSYLPASGQFAELCNAIADAHPAHAEEMREWSARAKSSLLRDLAKSSERLADAVVSEWWRIYKGTRQLCCTAQYLSSGIDLRLLEGELFKRTQLAYSAQEAAALSEQWRLDSLDRGWRTSPPISPAMPDNLDDGDIVVSQDGSHFVVQELMAGALKAVEIHQTHDAISRARIRAAERGSRVWVKLPNGDFRQP